MKKIAVIIFIIPFILLGCWSGVNNADKTKVIIFHAGSLSVPLRMMAEEYEKLNPGIDIEMEGAGSIACARKITELDKPCDIMASADYMIIDEMLIPDFASFNIMFASNSMVIAYTEKSIYSGRINSDNWMEILLDEEIIYGRADPDADPCGYRTLFTIKLAEKYYGKPGFSEKMVLKDRNMLRPKGVELIALLETNAIDYAFEYRSVAEQHGLKYLSLPGEINLSEVKWDSLYSTVSVDIKGKRPGDSLTIAGSTMVYGITLIENGPETEAAIDFLKFFIGEKGLSIIENNGQRVISPLTVSDDLNNTFLLNKVITNNELELR